MSWIVRYIQAARNEKKSDALYAFKCKEKLSNEKKEACTTSKTSTGRNHKSVSVVVKGRTDQWWRNMIGGNLPDSFWKKNFRMSKDLFHELAAELVPYIAPIHSSPNYRLLDTEKSLEQLRQDELIRISFIYQGKCTTNSFVLLGLVTVKIYVAKLHSTFIIQ